jgi:O-antigen/teichoic acid export membrane protein
MSQRGIEHRALRVASVTGLSTVVAIGMQIITVPICLKYWGPESYGTWLALFSVFSMFQLTSAGFINYVSNQVNLLYHQSQAELQKTLASALVGVAILGGLQLLVGVGIALWGALPGLVVVADNGSDPWLLNLAMLVLILSWFLGGFYLGIVHRLMVPAGLMYQAAWWSLGHNLSLFLVIVLAAVAKANILQVSLIYAVVSWSIVVASAWYVSKKLPQFFPWWRGMSVSQGVGDMIRSLPQILSALIQQGSTNGLVLLVSAMAGAAAVPVFTTVRTLSNLWVNVTNVLTTPLLPEVVRLHVKAEHDKLLVVQQVHGVIVAGSVNLSILLAYPVIDPLYAYWTRQAVALDKVLLCTLLGSVSFFSFGSMMNTFLVGVNHNRTIFFVTSLRGGISLLLGAALMRHFGIAGLGLAVWIAELGVLGLQVYYFHDVTRRGTRLVPEISNLAPALLGVVALTIFLGLAAVDFSPAWLHGLCLLGTCTSVYWGWVSLSDEVRERLLHLISRRLGANGT